MKRLEDAANSNNQDANNKIQLLEDNMNNMNTKIEDVSKQQGPRGYNGSRVKRFALKDIDV